MSVKSKRAPWACLAAMILAVVSLAPARAAELGEIVGNWTVGIMMPTGAQLGELLVVEKEGALTATLKSQLPEAHIEDIELEGDEILLTYMLKMGEQEMDVQVVVKVDGDAFEGNVLVGGGAMEFGVKGAKVGTDAEAALKKEIADAQAPVGGADGAEGLDSSEAKEFIEDWVLIVESPEGGDAQIVDFKITDDGGKLLADLDFPDPIGHQVIRDIAKTDDGIKLTFKLEFGSQEFVVNMDLQRIEDELKGGLGDAGGLFEIQLTGMTNARAEAILEGGGSLTSGDGDGDTRARRGGGRGRERLTSGAADISLGYGKAATDGETYQQIQAGVEVGTTLPLGMGEATKIKIAGAGLKIGDNTLPAGWYSIWLRFTGEGWSFVFNEKADVWSTQYRPAGDLFAVPMELTTIDEPNEALEIALEEDGDAVVLKATWGANVGSVRMTVAE